MIAFVNSTAQHCRAPVQNMEHNPPGPDMWICGERVLPGKTACAEYHARLYYKPTAAQLKSFDWAARRSTTYTGRR